MTHPKTYTAKTGVRFLYVRREEIISLRGRRKHVDVWQGLCEKCHAPFIVTVPASSKAAPRTTRMTGQPYPQFTIKHCKAHRLSRRECLAEARKAIDPEKRRAGLEKARARSLEVRREKALKRWAQIEADRIAKQTANQERRRQRRAREEIALDDPLKVYGRMSITHSGLPLDAVDEIREARGIPARELALLHGISPDMVRSIRCGRVHAPGVRGQLALGLVRSGSETVQDIAQHGVQVLKGLARLESLGIIAVGETGEISRGARWGKA